jgi:dipeptidyl-peptidase-4
VAGGLCRRKEAVVQRPGFHDANFAPTGGAFVERFSTRMDPPTVSLCQADGARLFWTTKALEPYQLSAPEQIEVKAKTAPRSMPPCCCPRCHKRSERAADRESLRRPGAGDGGKSLGRWTALRRAAGRAWLCRPACRQSRQRCARPGFCAGRLSQLWAGATGRSVDGGGRGAGQVSATGSKRLGWWGWSWGGTFTLYALTHSDRFRAGVAVAPVTDWHNYDSIYTERYMSEPAEFA